MRSYTHPEAFPPMRADKALSAFFADEVSRTRLESSFKDGKVLLRGEAVTKKHMLEPGDCVELELPEAPKTQIGPVEIPIEIVYEDDDIVAVNKPVGMTVHPGSGTGDDTLAHAMLFHTKGKLSTAGGQLRPGIVHRLDKETSGVMVMAKTDGAYYRLIELFSERDVDKEYLALVSGVPTVRSGAINKAISRHPVFKTKMCVADDETGKNAYTQWRMLESFGSKAALLACKILTGRTHQIRVHLSDAGFPILGDYTYKFQKNKFKDLESPQRVMLHSWKLEIPHPVSGERLVFQAEPPQDFKGLIENLKNAYNFESI